MKIAAFLVCCLSLLAQDTAGTGTITGLVRDSAGLAAAGIQACVVESDRCATLG